MDVLTTWCNRMVDVNNKEPFLTSMHYLTWTTQCTQNHWDQVDRYHYHYTSFPPQVLPTCNIEKLGGPVDKVTITSWQSAPTLNLHCNRDANAHCCYWKLNTKGLEFWLFSIFTSRVLTKRLILTKHLLDSHGKQIPVVVSRAEAIPIYTSVYHHNWCIVDSTGRPRISNKGTSCTLVIHLLPLLW